MRRIGLLAGAMLAIAALARPTAIVAQQPDGVARLVSSLAAAISSGRADDLRALTAPGLAAADAAALQGWTAAQPDRVTARERDRQTLPGGVRLLIEALIEKGHRGTVATWQVDARPRADASGAYEITAFRQVDMIGGLFRLALDRSQEFRVHDLVFTAPDLTLTLHSGVAFLVSADDGVTGVIVRGDGELSFRPPGAAEQGQLILLAKHPALTLPLNATFIRFDPDEFASRMTNGLTPMGVVKNDADRATEIFNSLAPNAYHIGLGDLSSASWSVLPLEGDVAIEMDTRKFGWLTYTHVAADPEDVSLADRARRHNISLYRSADLVARRGNDWSEDDNRVYDVLHTDVSVHIAPDREWVSGSATLRLRIQAASATVLTVRLADSLVISSVTSATADRLLFLRVLGQNSVLISLPKAVEQGETVALTMTYAGRLPARPPGREAMTVTPDQDTAPDTTLRPDNALIYSENVAWYPQGPNTDFGTATLSIAVPSGFDVVATGSREPDDDADAAEKTTHEHTVRFQVTRPVRYLACAVTHFVPVAQMDVPVAAVAAPTTGASSGTAAAVHLTVVAQLRQVSHARALAGPAGNILALFATLIGEAPYPDFTLAALDADLPGGHSPAYFTLLNQPLPMSPYTWAGDPVVFEDSPHFMLAHEIAHQWWGQAVGMKNYHDEWLSEGLAQYFALVATGTERGPDARRDLLRRMSVSVTPYLDLGPISFGYRVGHLSDEPRAFRAIVYNKSAIVLDMLRRFIGDEAFANGLRRFYRGFRFRKAGTSDLRAAFEAESHRSLARFFERWIDGTAVPQLRVRARIGPAADAVLLHVEQAGPVFDVPIGLRVEYADGSVGTLSVPVTDAVTDVTLPLTRPARKVSVDGEVTLARVRQAGL